MTDTLAEKWRKATPAVELATKLRKEHDLLPARHALQWARHQLRDVDRYKFRGYEPYEAKFVKDGFTVVIHVLNDEMPSYDHLGEFTDKWQPGAIKNPEGWYGENWDIRNSHVMAYFVPQESRDELAKAFHRSYSKQVAMEKAAAIIKHNLEAAKEYRSYWVRVTVFRANILLGTATLGGLDFTDDVYEATDVDAEASDFVNENGLVDEAIAEAVKNLPSITTRLMEGDK